MKTLRKYLVFTVILVGVFSLAYVQFYSGRESQGSEDGLESGRWFVENDRIRLDVDSDGDADGSLESRMEKSELTDIIKLSIDKLGEDYTEKSYVKSVRTSFALEGIEVENASCEIQGTGEDTPLSVSVRWKSPGVARRTENQWEIKFDWIDEQAAAREHFSRTRDDWVLLRNIVETYGFSRAQFKISSIMNIKMPENAQNADYSSKRGYEFYYGGGTYMESSTRLKRISGVPVLVENEVVLISSENKITASPEDLIENAVSTTFSYSRKIPDSWGFYDSVDSVRLDLKYGRQLEEKYPFPLENEGQTLLEQGQIIYILAEKVLTLDNGQDISVDRDMPDIEISQGGLTDFSTCWENFSKENYLSLAQKIIEKMDSEKNLENELKTPFGRSSAQDALYNLSRIISSYGERKKLPKYIEFVPVPQRKLRIGNAKVNSDLAYQLLPSRKVIMDSPRINNILSGFQNSKFSDRELAKKLLEWTHENISYQALSFGKSSEETLRDGQGKCLDYTNVYLALLRSAGIPSRKVSGWVVSDWQPPEGWSFIAGHTPEGDPIAGHAWAQFYLPEEGWTFADPTAGTFDNLPYEVYTSVEQSWVDSLSAYETKFGTL